jgi:hypothetical protein
MKKPTKKKRPAKVVSIKRKVIFKARPNYRVTDKDARTIGKRLLELGASPTLMDVGAADMLADAKKPSSPLHKYFDWDVERAAEKHWLQRASYLIRSVAVEIRVVGGGVVTRAWHSVHVEIGTDTDTGAPIEERRYVPVDVVKKNPTLVEQILGDALRELRGWADRFSSYSSLSEVHAEAHRELEPIYRVIDQLEARISDRPNRKVAG